MRRRRFLRAAVAVGGGAAAAGCSSLEGALPGSTPTPSDGERSRAAERIDAAKAHVGAAARALGEEADGFAGGDLGVSFRASKVTGHLKQARTELDAARPKASESQQQTIQVLSKAIRFLATTTRTMNRVAAGFDDLNAGLTYHGDGRYKDAAGALRKAKEHFAGARESLDAAKQGLAPLRDAKVEVFDRAEVSSLESALGRLDAVVATIRPYTDGYLAFTLGSKRLFAGLDRYRADAFEKAKTHFSAARKKFDRAGKRFTAAEKSAPPGLRRSVIRTTCYAGAFRAASARFHEAAAAAGSGNGRAAKQKMSAGKEALNRCSSSGSN